MMSKLPDIEHSSIRYSKDDTPVFFIVTGFGPFGGVKENPTTVIIRELDAYLRTKSFIVSDETKINIDAHFGSKKPVMLADLVQEYIVLETSAEDVSETIERIRREYLNGSFPLTKASKSEKVTSSSEKVRNGGNCRWILLHLGVARSSCFRLESCAYNDASFRIPDEKGFQPMDERIVVGHELGRPYHTSLNLQTLHTKLEKTFPKISTVVSMDPGRYVCNYVYCKSLQLASLSGKVMEDSSRTDNSSRKNLDLKISDSKPSSSSIEFGKKDANDDEKRAENVSLCTSLFLHVPHFDIVPRSEQLAYVATLIQNLASQ